jgi:small subunit ribosomal protein S6
MALYEHVFLARQDVSTQQVEALTKEFSDIIEAGGGKIAKSEYWGVKTLNFKIKKNRKAHYGLLNIDAPPAAVAEMERRMSLSTDILRFLTIKVEAHETEPSAPMRKGDRDERGDRGDRGDRGPRGGGGGRFGDRGGDRGGFRGDRPPREGGGFRADRGDRPPRDGDAPRGDRPPRDGDGFRGPRPPRDGDAPRAPRPPRPDQES